MSITCNSAISFGNECNGANIVVILDHDHVIEKNGVSGKTVAAPVTIGSKVWTGANVVIAKGVTIGDGAVVAAGAVEVNDIPTHEIWGSVPT